MSHDSVEMTLNKSGELMDKGVGTIDLDITGVTGITDVAIRSISQGINPRVEQKRMAISYLYTIKIFRDDRLFFPGVTEFGPES
jgi:hypothetical protein